MILAYVDIPGAMSTPQNDLQIGPRPAHSVQLSKERLLQVTGSISKLNFEIPNQKDGGNEFEFGRGCSNPKLGPGQPRDNPDNRTTSMQSGDDGTPKLSPNSPSTRIESPLARPHSFARLARAHARTKRNDFPVGINPPTSNSKSLPNAYDSHYACYRNNI